jgi:hypothetical protein
MKKAFAIFGLLIPAVALLISCGMGPGDKGQSQSPTNTTQGKVENWSYSTKPDQMGRGSIKNASTTSINTVSFGFPYQGDQHGTLLLRNHPRYGKDIIFIIEKGQFLSGIDGCEVVVRFDENKPVTFRAVGPEDNSTTNIFIKGYSQFVKSLKRSKLVKIEAPFFQEGQRVFEFNVEGLVWETDTPKKK